MNKLCSKNKFNPTKESISLALQQYRIFDFDFRPITKGIANTTIYIRSKNKELILRFYAQHRKTDEDIIFELNFQNYLRENEIPIPKIYTSINGDQLTFLVINRKKWQIVLMEFISGTSKTDHTPELIKELSLLQARMHILGTRFSYPLKREGKSWKKLEDYYAIYIKNTHGHPKTVRDFIIRAKNFTYPLDQKLPFGYNHLDLDLDGNVIVKNNRIKGIVDFDDLSYSPISVCLGYSLWNVLHDENMRSMKKYLKYYESIRPLEESERLALLKIILFRNYEIGALRLYKTGDISCLKRPFEIEKEINSIQMI